MTTKAANEQITSFAALKIAVLGSGRCVNDAAEALAVLAEPRLSVFRWPDDVEAVELARERRHPRLLVVEGDHEPPTPCDRLEEWVRLPADGRDVQARIAALRCRAAELPPERGLTSDERLAEVVSARDIAARVPQLTPQRLHGLRRSRSTFPKPVGRRGHELVWDWTDIRRWANNTLHAELRTRDQ